MICLSTGLIVAAVHRLATVATALLPPPEGWCFIQTRNGEFGRRWGRGERRDEENVKDGDDGGGGGGRGEVWVADVLHTGMMYSPRRRSRSRTRSPHRRSRSRTRSPRRRSHSYSPRRRCTFITPPPPSHLSHPHTHLPPSPHRSFSRSPRRRSYSRSPVRRYRQSYNKRRSYSRSPIRRRRRSYSRSPIPRRCVWICGL